MWFRLPPGTPLNGRASRLSQRAECRHCSQDAPAAKALCPANRAFRQGVWSSECQKQLVGGGRQPGCGKTTQHQLQIQGIPAAFKSLMAATNIRSRSSKCHRRFKLFLYIYSVVYKADRWQEYATNLKTKLETLSVAPQHREGNLITEAVRTQATAPGVPRKTGLRVAGGGTGCYGVSPLEWVAPHNVGAKGKAFPLINN